MQRPPMGIGNGYDTGCRLITSILVLEMGFHQSESHSRLSGGARFRYHHNAVVFAVKQGKKLRIVVLAQRMSGIYHIGMSPSHHGGKLRLQGFDDHAGTQVGSPNADNHKQFALGRKARHVGMNASDDGGIKIFRQVYPAEKIVAGGITVDKVALGSLNLRLDSLVSFAPHKVNRVFNVDIDLLHIC